MIWHQCLLLVSGVKNWATLSRLNCEDGLAPCEHEMPQHAPQPLHVHVHFHLSLETLAVRTGNNWRVVPLQRLPRPRRANQYYASLPELSCNTMSQPCSNPPHALETVHRGRSRAAESVAPAAVVIRPVSLPVAPPPLVPRAGVVAVAGPVAIPAAGRKGLALGCRLSSSFQSRRHARRARNAGACAAGCWLEFTGCVRVQRATP